MLRTCFFFLFLLPLVATLQPLRLSAASSLVDRLFPGSPTPSTGQQRQPDASAAYTERLAIGREAQLGSSLLYCPGAIGCEIDSALTYGEYDLSFFAALVDSALNRGGGCADGKTFVDVGSGCGRLVFAAAVLWPSLSNCVGIEKVERLHALALEALSRAELPPDSPQCDFLCSDALDFICAPRSKRQPPDCLFAYSSTWPSHGDVLTDMSLACATLPVGCRIVTTDKKLASDGTATPGDHPKRCDCVTVRRKPPIACADLAGWRFELLETMEGPNLETGGSSTGKFRVAPSLSCDTRLWEGRGSAHSDELPPDKDH